MSISYLKIPCTSKVRILFFKRYQMWTTGSVKQKIKSFKRFQIKLVGYTFLWIVSSGQYSNTEKSNPTWNFFFSKNYFTGQFPRGQASPRLEMIWKWYGLRKKSYAAFFIKNRFIPKKVMNTSFSINFSSLNSFSIQRTKQDYHSTGTGKRFRLRHVPLI